MTDMTGRSFAISGLRVANARMRVAMENLANANSTGEAPGADPYRRKSLVFEPINDRDDPRMRIVSDDTPFRTRSIPGHPAADERGQVKLPNVSEVAETSKLQSAMSAYTRNARALSMLDEVERKTLDVLKS